jgi:hypothetical protein
VERRRGRRSGRLSSRSALLVKEKVELGLGKSSSSSSSAAGEEAARAEAAVERRRRRNPSSLQGHERGRELAGVALCFFFPKAQNDIRHLWYGIYL